jgi:hypothetical protein
MPNCLQQHDELPYMGTWEAFPYRLLQWLRAGTSFAPHVNPLYGADAQAAHRIVPPNNAYRVKRASAYCALGVSKSRSLSIIIISRLSLSYFK